MITSGSAPISNSVKDFVRVVFGCPVSNNNNNNNKNNNKNSLL